MTPLPEPAATTTPTPASRIISLRQLLVIVILWNTGFKGARVVSTLFALHLGAGPFDIGLLLATYSLLPLLLAVQAGKISDRYGSGIPLAAGLLLSAVGVLLPFLWPTLPALFVAAAVSGAGFIVVQVGMQKLTGSLGGGAARTSNINAYSLVVAVADFLGPVLAGFSIDLLHHASAYVGLGLLNVLSFAGFLFFLQRLPPVAPATSERREQRTTDLLRLPQLRRLLMVSAVVMLGLDLFQLYIPIYGHSIGLSATAIGLVMGSFAAAVFVTRAVMPALAARYGEERILMWSLAMAGATFMVIPFFSSGVVLGAVCFVLGLGMGLGQPLSVILTFNYSPPARVGEAIGLRITINNAMHIIIPPAFGAVGAITGLAPVFWVTGLAIGLGAYASRRRGGA